MKSKLILTTSSILLYTVGITALIFGFIYLSRNDIMSYHYAFLQVSSSQINTFSPKLLELILALMKISGASCISLGLASIILVAIPFRKGKAWAKWLLLIIFSLTLFPFFIVTYKVASCIPTGEPIPPWYITLIMEIMVILGVGMSFLNNNQDKSRLKSK